MTEEQNLRLKALAIAVAMLKDSPPRDVFAAADVIIEYVKKES